MYVYPVPEVFARVVSVFHEVVKFCGEVFWNSVCQVSAFSIADWKSWGILKLGLAMEIPRMSARCVSVSPPASRVLSQCSLGVLKCVNKLKITGSVVSHLASMGSPLSWCFSSSWYPNFLAVACAKFGVWILFKKQARATASAPRLAASFL